MDAFNKMCEDNVKGFGIQKSMFEQASEPPRVIRTCKMAPGSGMIKCDDPTQGLREIIAKASKTRVRRKKEVTWVGAEILKAELSPIHVYGPFWRKIDPQGERIVCKECREEPGKRARNWNNPTCCLYCQTNYYANGHQYQVQEKRKDVVSLGARIQNMLTLTGMDKMDINADMVGSLTALSDALISNKCMQEGEKIMKALSHMGEIRVPPEHAPNICAEGKLKRYSVLIERSFNTRTQSAEEYFRLGKDYGNVAYSEFLAREEDQSHVH